MKIPGYCPMGCGRTLFADDDGHIICSWIECPNPTAVDDLLSIDEPEHIVVIRDRDFTVQHPIRERLNGDMFTCEIHQRISALSGPPAQFGRYTVYLRDDGTWAWVPMPEIMAAT